MTTEKGLMVSAEPESLLQMESGMQEKKVEEPPVISHTLVTENNNIDPAILKAMGPPDNGKLISVVLTRFSESCSSL